MLQQGEISLLNSLPWRAWAPLLPRRFVVPHVVVDSTTAGLTSDEWDAFARYLSGDDTRLPSHELLKTKAADPVDYNTFVGEDVWNAHAGPACDAPAVAPVPPFAAVVEFVDRQLKSLNEGGLPRDADYGVVVSGDFSTADDAGWAVASRSVRCGSASDVFRVLRCSTKLAHDWERQQGMHHSAGGSSCALAFWLKKYVAFEPSFEFRMFYCLPPPGVDDVAAGGEAASSPTLLLPLMGVCQRCVDQVFPHLAGMSLADNARLYRHLQLSMSAPRLGSFWAAVQKQARLLRAGGDGNNNQGIVYIDVVYQSESLPLYVIGVGVSDNSAPDSAAKNVGDFRLFGSQSELRAHCDDAESKVRVNPATAPPRTIYVATCREELSFDGRHLTAGLPIELQHPELFIHDAGLAEFLTQFHEQQRAQSQSNMQP